MKDFAEVIVRGAIWFYGLMALVFASGAAVLFPLIFQNDLPSIVVPVMPQLFGISSQFAFVSIMIFTLLQTIRFMLPSASERQTTVYVAFMVIVLLAGIGGISFMVYEIIPNFLDFYVRHRQAIEPSS